MIENLMNTLLIMIVISIFLSIIGFITKVTFGADVSFYVNLITIIIGVLAITIYTFTTSNKDVAENLMVVAFWFLNMILFVIIPMTVGEVVSRILYNIAGMRPD